MPKHEKRHIVCICGSMRFYSNMHAYATNESLKGNIVLFPFPSADTEDRHKSLHEAKIRLSDEILVVNVRGYIGESTASEIEYARSHGVKVRYTTAVKEGENVT